MSKIAKNKSKIRERIELLEAQSEELRAELEGDFVETKTKVATMGKVVLGVAGGLIFSAIVLGGLSGRKGKKNGKRLDYGYGSRKVYHRFRDQLTHELSSQLMEFLLGVAKDRLSAYVEKNEDGEQADS